MSPEGAAGSPERAPKEFLESPNEVQMSPEERHRAFRSLSVFSKAFEKAMKIIDFLSSEGRLGAQTCIEKALGIRF